MTQKQPHAFDNEDISEVLASVTGSAESNVLKHIAGVVEQSMRDVLLNLVNMSHLGNLGAPQVMLRVRTLQTILDDFRLVLGSQYDDVLKRIGRNIGFNFAITLSRILKQSNHIPLTYQTLFNFWARFDSAAQMGEFAFELRENSTDSYVDIRIKDLFLTHGYGDDEPLRHSPFILGYLEGALDSICFLWTRSMKATVYEKPKVLFCTGNCGLVGHENEHVSHFRIDLKVEPFPELKDALVEGLDASAESHWVGATVSGRRALERGIARLVRAQDPGMKFSFGKLLEEVQNVRIQIDASRWRRAYDNCSEFAHKQLKANEIIVNSILFDVWRCVKEVEIVVPTTEQSSEINSRRAKYIVP